MPKKCPAKKPAKRRPAPKYPWIAADLRRLAVPIDKLKPDPDNARIHDEANLRAIAASLKEFGQRKALVANRNTGLLEAGNGTLEAARRLGWSHLAVVWVEDDATAARGFSIADNRAGDLADWDLDLLLMQRDTLPTGLTDALSLIALDQPNEREKTPDADPRLSGLEYRIIVLCRDEEHQGDLLARFQQEGLECRALIS